MLSDGPAPRDALATPLSGGALRPAERLRSAAPDSTLGLCRGFSALLVVTYGLIVLGALVRAHEAGLACPDWPLCFGQLLPQLDLQVGFEWAHRLIAGGVALGFAGLATAALRSPPARRRAKRWLALGAVLLATQILLGALTVWQLLASWTVTSHLLVGNAVAATWLLTALSLRERRAPAPPAPRLARLSQIGVAVLLLGQLALGGLVSSRYAGMACPEWPTCNGGLWFPSWQGNVGLHLLHRSNGYALLAALIAAALLCRGTPGLRGVAWGALGLGLLQVCVGVANVRLGIPVEVTGLHSALATALVLCTAFALRQSFRRPDFAG